MRRGTYTLALYALAPLIWLWMARRARRAGGEWGIFSAPRFGHPDDAAAAPFKEPPVWLHAVSLGETRAAQPLIQALLDRGLPVLLTHTTATGRTEGARLFSHALATGQLKQTWLPYDFPAAVRRFLSHYRPRCGLLIEREIWPNLLAEARRQGVRMALVSARFSESSLRQAKWLGAALRDALAGLDTVLAQTPDDARRLRLAGAGPVSVAGNLKFDMRLPADQLRAGRAFRKTLGRPVVLVASTREGEDALFAQAIHNWLKADRDSADSGDQGDGERAQASRMDAACRANVLFILVPRHPQRFDSAAQALREADLPMDRRSRLGDGPEDNGRLDPEPASGLAERVFSLPGPQTAVLLGDSLGEMPFYYAAADVAIVAGSFLPFGGQNLIEACAAGAATIVGPHTFNFKQAAEDAIAAGAVCRANDVAQALQLAGVLLGDESRRARMGHFASAWAEHHAGAASRTMAALETWLIPPRRNEGEGRSEKT